MELDETGNEMKQRIQARDARAMEDIDSRTLQEQRIISRRIRKAIKKNRENMEPGST